MSGANRDQVDEIRNKAKEEHAAADEDVKPFTDTSDVAGGESWAGATGHSGTRHAWAVSLAMVASFLLGAGGLAFGPRVLLWVGVGLFVALSVYSLSRRVWTD
jgi:hypothetical protein